MSTETIWSRIREIPFKPFRMRTSDGQHYDILHPEMIMLTKQRITVAIFDRPASPGEDLPDRQAFISPLHVTSVEDVPRRTRKTGRR
jgi:hypothetical protein